MRLYWNGVYQGSPHEHFFNYFSLRDHLGFGISGPNAGFSGSDKQILGGIAGYF